MIFLGSADFPGGIVGIIFAKTSLMVNSQYKTDYVLSHQQYLTWQCVPFRIDLENVERVFSWILNTALQNEWYWTITVTNNAEESTVLYNFYFKNPQLAVLFKLSCG